MNIFFQVKRKNSPVIDADVEVLIVTGNKKWNVKLLDNGNGGQSFKLPFTLSNAPRMPLASIIFQFQLPLSYLYSISKPCKLRLHSSAPILCQFSTYTTQHTNILKLKQ